MTGRAIFALGTGVGDPDPGSGPAGHRGARASLRDQGAGAARSSLLSASVPRPSGARNTPRFLRRVGAGHLAATVLLPRTEVIVRQVALPGVADRDLASAVPLQIDALHPYGDDEAGHAWARLPATESVLIGIARKAVMSATRRLFIEAGIKIAAFTFSAAVLYSALCVSCRSRPRTASWRRRRDRSWKPMERARRKPVFFRGPGPAAGESAALGGVRTAA